MHELEVFVTIIEKLALILRESKFIFTSKRHNNSKIIQDNTLT